MDDLEHLESDFAKTEYLQNILIDSATGGISDDRHYQFLRQYLLNNSVYNPTLPQWVKTNRNLSQFWQFIKYKFPSYQERRNFIWNEFQPLLNILESKQTTPSEKSISDYLSKFDSEGIHYAWSKALERRSSDPEGAITIARTIIESVCKHILDRKNAEYNSSNIELSELYKLVAQELKLAPEQHGEQVFKQILGGCSGIVNGLGSLRNKLGDAHGQGVKNVKPKTRHAELAVNLAGTMALFLIQTYEENNNASQ
jgi:hypothetical protein